MRRVLICGDRNWTCRRCIREFIDGLPVDAVIIEGEAPGADTFAREHANGRMVLPFPAEWHKYGRAAGPIRNKAMLDHGKPTDVAAFHNDIEHSKGTKNMLEQARQQSIPTMLHLCIHDPAND